MVEVYSRLTVCHISRTLAGSWLGEDMQPSCHNARTLHTSSLTQGSVKGMRQVDFICVPSTPYFLCYIIFCWVVSARNWGVWVFVAEDLLFLCSLHDYSCILLCSVVLETEKCVIPLAIQTAKKPQNLSTQRMKTVENLHHVQFVKSILPRFFFLSCW